MVKVTKALPEQLPLIIPCALEFTSIIPDLNFNADYYIAFWTTMVQKDLGVMFLLEDKDGIVQGALGGIKYPQPLTGELCAVEMCWYVKSVFRGNGRMLYDAFEKWAKEQACKKIAMIYLPCSMPDVLHKFYTGQGYKLMEMHYEKEV